MKLVLLDGTGTERGYQHGSQLAVEIRDTVDALKTHLRAAGHDPESLARRLLASPLSAMTEQWLPDLWQEALATAEGAGLRTSDICLLVFLDEVWGLTRAGCSVIARRTSQCTEVGQTMDLPDWTIGRPIVLHVLPAASQPQLVMSYPGNLGLCGASTRIAVAVNALALFGLREEGLGVAFILRHLLTLSSVEEVEAFLREVPHAAGQAYTVGDGSTIATFEAGPDVLRRVSEPAATACLHTNHPLGMIVNPERSTSIRLASLQTSIAGDGGIEEALSEAVVLDGVRYGDPNSTFAAFVSRSGRREVSFIDGVDLRAGSGNWVSFALQ
jgi:hypothetical protein